MKTIKVDFNNRAHGCVVGPLRRLQDAKVGDDVILEDFGAEKPVVGTVERVDSEHHRIYFTPQWDRRAVPASAASHAD